ncbi:hypothetical protein E4U13_001047 [Claviceps humidiphila]|uniref:Zn(2)-C6 fungal-type domain-containing protein n=1 Tax=Claviceps humidiphila TaxID=1294629 RepID=A0A9P7Q1U1_9HYPO|nr:hypothetical protein E4U13_001047 [Claviceps humidiphila]
MAAAQIPKAKLALKASNGISKSKTQTHRRSRTGCYTCRLRRKKCDEGTPMCTACKHLGLQCEYKRPVWWSNNDARRQHKEDIKNVIKRKKLVEKSSGAMHASVSPPPGLSHSLPTPATLSDTMNGTRSASIDSHCSTFHFNSPPRGAALGTELGTEFAISTEIGTGYNTGYGTDYGTDYGTGLGADFGIDFVTELGTCRGLAAAYSPYEVDVKTERQMFVNDVPTLREAHIATFSTLQTPPSPGTVLPADQLEGACAWMEPIEHRSHRDHVQETLDVHFFDFAHGPNNRSRNVHIELEDGDQRLLDHFVHHVMPIIFPILEANQHGSVGSDLMLPALQANSVYLHCCLGIAAQHLKMRASLAPADLGAVSTDADLDADIMKHRCATILSLCDLLKRDEDHQQMLEATLGLIFLQCTVGRIGDGLPDIAWHQHFQAAINLVQKLDLPSHVVNPAGQVGPVPFNMALASWIDILGATMQGTPPAFANTYRDKLLCLNWRLGLRELMGCDDRVMYLISEIACLDWLKTSGMDELTLCQHAEGLGRELTATEADQGWPKMPYSSNGTLSPKQLCLNITAAFRIAARIYLVSLIPGFSPSQASMQGLMEKLTMVLQLIPSGPHGYDRSMVWVYLMAASVALPGSGFRDFFQDRVAQLGDAAASSGSFGRMATIVREVWKQADIVAQVTLPGSTISDSMYPHVNWRDVMQSNGWDFLLI